MFANGILPAALSELELLLRALDAHSGTTRYRRKAGSSEVSASTLPGGADLRKAARSARRTIQRRGPAFDARSSPVAIQRRTVTTVTWSSSATWEGVKSGSEFASTALHSS